MYGLWAVYTLLQFNVQRYKLCTMKSLLTLLGSGTCFPISKGQIISEHFVICKKLSPIVPYILYRKGIIFWVSKREQKTCLRLIHITYLQCNVNVD